MRQQLDGESLDRALSTGVNPADSTALAERSAWLTSERNRRSLAPSIRDLLEPTERRGSTAAPQPHTGELAYARLPLVWIAAMLETDEPVYSHGVARLQLLLSDCGSPLYEPQRAGQLLGEIGAILDALEGREETW
jgi:hypothetical protein